MKEPVDYRPLTMGGGGYESKVTVEYTVEIPGKRVGNLCLTGKVNVDMWRAASRLPVRYGTPRRDHRWQADGNLRHRKALDGSTGRLEPDRNHATSDLDS